MESNFLKDFSGMRTNLFFFIMLQRTGFTETATVAMLVLIFVVLFS